MRKKYLPIVFASTTILAIAAVVFSGNGVTATTNALTTASTAVTASPSPAPSFSPTPSPTAPSIEPTSTPDTRISTNILTTFTFEEAFSAAVMPEDGNGGKTISYMEYYHPGVPDERGRYMAMTEEDAKEYALYQVNKYFVQQEDGRYAIRYGLQISEKGAIVVNEEEFETMKPRIDKCKGFKPGSKKLVIIGENLYEGADGIGICYNKQFYVGGFFYNDEYDKSKLTYKQKKLLKKERKWEKRLHEKNDDWYEKLTINKDHTKIVIKPNIPLLKNNIIDMDIVNGEDWEKMPDCLQAEVLRVYTIK